MVFNVGASRVEITYTCNGISGFWRQKMETGMVKTSGSREAQIGSPTSALARLAARIGEISTLPEVVYRILTLVEDPESGAADLAEAVRSDPALAMRVMRTVNSPYYGLEEKVADLQQAIAILGFREIRNLAITSHVATLFRTSGGHNHYSRRGLWQHLVATGLVSRMIAQTTGRLPPDEVYLAGLLHDLGLILLDQYAHASFSRVVDALSLDRPTWHIEMEVLGFSHAELGQTVARQWNLPEHLTAAIGFHHRPDQIQGAYCPLVCAVAVADFLCHRQDVSSLGVANAPMPPADIFLQLALGREALNQIVVQLEKALHSAEIMAFLHVR